MRNLTKLALRLCRLSNASNNTIGCARPFVNGWMPTLCDNAACPNLNDTKKLKRCAACRLFFYCCTSCQRDSWRRGHRERCNELQKSQRVARYGERSTIEIAFLKYVLVSSCSAAAPEMICVHVFDFTSGGPMKNEESYQIDLFKSLDNFAKVAQLWSAGEGIIVCVILPTFHEETARRLYLVSHEDLRRVRHGSSITYRANDRQLLSVP
ncbi:hypothetical protein CPB85DRAFT_1345528 [Mucidula mucida]|nr:hypothetical protein CPB85DRAFT_1345528 [Mucidula mucida]